MGLLGSIGKALAFTVTPLTWVAARGVELVTGKDDIVRNNPFTYYTDIFKGSDDAKKAAPAGGAAAGQAALEGYGSGLDYEAAIARINSMAEKP